MVLKEVSAVEWSALRARPDRPRLIDVREPWEFNLVHLPEAENVPMGDIYALTAGYDKAADYVIVCHHGVRSASVCSLLMSFGFKRVRNFAGGLDAWSSAGLPVVEDLGSGSLVELEHYGIHDEPTVQNSIRAGVDVVSFSGDKLLGGPQAGIILGKKPYIDRMKRHPLARAIRVDKMTIAALWATLTTYQDLHRAEQEIPTLAMLAVSGEDLRASAAQLCALLKERGVAAEVVAQSGPVGGGSVPTQLLPTFAVALPADKLSPNQAEQALRCREKPIIGRITEGRLLLDVRTIFPEDMEYIADTAAEVLA